jgi:hypothetical protein
VGPGKAGRHAGRRVPGWSDDLQALGFDALFLLWRQHGNDRDAFDLELGVDPEDIARLGLGGEEVTVENAPGLQGPGGTPGPAAIGPRTGQLDVDPACHGA